MKARFGLLALASAALAMTACGEGVEEPQPSEPATAEEIAAQTPNAPQNRPIELMAEGLVIQPSEAGDPATTLTFGDPQDAVVEQLTRVFGGPQFGTNEECGVGPLTFATFESFSANFQDDRFVGWTVDGASERATFSGPGNIAVGMARADAESVPGYERYEESTLGEEFTVGEGEAFITGMIEDGQVSILWAGMDCAFR